MALELYVAVLLAFGIVALAALVTILVSLFFPPIGAKIVGFLFFWLKRFVNGIIIKYGSDKSVSFHFGLPKTGEYIYKMGDEPKTVLLNKRTMYYEENTGKPVHTVIQGIGKSVDVMEKKQPTWEDREVSGMMTATLAGAPFIKEVLGGRKGADIFRIVIVGLLVVGLLAGLYSAFTLTSGLEKQQKELIKINSNVAAMQEQVKNLQAGRGNPNSTPPKAVIVKGNPTNGKGG